MAVFKSKIVTTSDTFQKNRADMLAYIEKLRALEARSVEKSSQRLPTFKKRNQIPPHERVSRLLDPGMPFLRLHTLGNYLHDDPNPETSIPGGSVIAGIGYVSGVRCLVWADDSGISAGAMTGMGAKLTISLLDMAKNLKLPLIHLVESAGANLVKFTVESWIGAGAVFQRLAHLSAMGVPTICVLHGGSTAGGAYMPGMSDYVIGVKENGMAALAGVALVRSATGEVANDRDLGGSEMHASTSGLVEYLADDDAHGIALAREVVGRLGWNDNTPKLTTQPYAEPVYDTDEIAGVVPTDFSIPYDVREVIARVVDGSDFSDFKPLYGASLVCVQASIMGQPCGIVGNNGPIDPQGATKAAQFYQLCDQANIPIIFLHNTTGFIVGTASEQAGMIKHGAKMVQAAANIRVPKITLHIGASFGAGNYAMCGKAYDPDFLFIWPSSRSNVMSGESAGKTMSQVAEAIAKRKGQEPDMKAIKAREDEIIDHFTKQESAFYTSGRILDHGVIDPRDTRKVLGFAIKTCLEARARTLNPNAFGVARL